MFTAKGSPVIKFIDFGGACTCTAEEGLVGLVGTPQYVAPEVVMGFGDDNPTDEPYGKPCDLWSMGVLLYVMLSKTMPFRAKEVDQLLKQVVRGRFHFRPEERWRHVSAEAKDLITKLLTVDASKRLTIGEVKQHPWAADAIAKCFANMPKLENKSLTGRGGGWLHSMLKKVPGSGEGSQKALNLPAGVRTRGSEYLKRKKRGEGGKEQQYWYAMEISPPTDMQHAGGVKVGKDGQFEMENVPAEMRAILEDIQKKKATESTRESARGGSTAEIDVAAAAAPPKPPGPPPGPPPDDAATRRQSIEKNAIERHASQSGVMDTLLAMNEKDSEIARLQEVETAQAAQLNELQQKVAALEIAKDKAVEDGKSLSAIAARQQAQLEAAAAPQEGAASSAELDALRAELAEAHVAAASATSAAEAAEARAKKAETEADEQMRAALKATAKLDAVTNLYTGAMQREAKLKVMVEHLEGGGSAADVPPDP